jgi:L-cysteine desulfidase
LFHFYSLFLIFLVKAAQMYKNDTISILKLMHLEVVPAIGCTEPIAVALAVSKAAELLDAQPTKLIVRLSANVLKNAMGVGIPGTDMYGLPIAIALGLIVGKSKYGLEVLKDVTPATLQQAKTVMDSGIVTIEQKEEATDKLYIEVEASQDTNRVLVIISHDHNRFTHLERNGVVLLESNLEETPSFEAETLELTFDKVCDFAQQTPLDDLRFMLQAADLNRRAAAESTKGLYGHSIGLIGNHPIARQVMGDSIFTRILSTTTSACDMRMAGALIPVMCNSGSGNQGITATLPVTIYADETGASEESLIRALTMSHLMAIYIKQSLGKLSALCGAMIAGIGSACGITYLMGGNREQISFSVKNMVGNLTGIICDGAKPSCSIKVMSAASTAVISALMAIENKVITQVEGIVDNDVDQTIRNLTRIGAEGMLETDKLILKIMTGK